jgi:hypothetical protein
LDHVIPTSKGGHPTKLSNLTILCHKCNQKKGNKIEALLIIDGVDVGMRLEVLKHHLFHQIDQKFSSRKIFQKLYEDTYTENLE